MNDDELKELIKKYEKGEISYSQLEIIWENYLSVLFQRDPLKYLKLQAEVLDQKIMEDNAFRVLTKEIFNKDGWRKKD